MSYPCQLCLDAVLNQHGVIYIRSARFAVFDHDLDGAGDAAAIVKYYEVAGHVAFGQGGHFEVGALGAAVFAIVKIIAHNADLGAFDGRSAPRSVAVMAVFQLLCIERPDR